MIEIAQWLAMELIDRMATVTKHQREPVLDELVPHGRLARAQIVRQKIGEQILADHQMGDVFFLHPLIDLIGTLSSGYGSQ